MAEASADELKWARRYRALLLLLDVAIFAGAWAAVTIWHPGAFLVLGGIVGLVACHLAVGIWAYRRTMRRPWPRVAPLEDGDDDW
jgi:hypothetical protein